MRTTFSQLRQSRFPASVGLCQSDIPQIASYVNEATERLINEAGEWGWWGGWAKVVFATASQLNPFITLPPQFARAIGFDVCRMPIRIQNQFYEVLDAGIGLRGPTNCADRCAPREAYDRGTFSTMFDLTPSNQFLRVYATDPTDIQAGKNVLISGAMDQNGHGIYSVSGNQQVEGVLLPLASPFTTSSMIITSFSQIGKDPTNGDVILSQVDATTGAEVILSRYGPTETGPSYRRYYFGALPSSCCPPATSGTPQSVTITALCKYEYFPVLRDTDFLLIGNIPALIEEAQAIKYSGMESPNAARLEAKHHAKATRLLNQELTHYLGEVMPAINFAPWGTARLERHAIGTLI